MVGADGVNSKVRNALMLPDTRRDAGIRSLGGAVVDKGQLEGFTTDAASFMVVERGPSMFVGRYTADSRDNVAGEKSGASVGVRALFHRGNTAMATASDVAAASLPCHGT